MNEKKLYKSTTNKKICGVCGGVAEYFGIDPTIVRLVWAVVTLFWGVGLILYIVAAVIMPAEDGMVDSEYKESETTDEENPYFKE